MKLAVLQSVTSVVVLCHVGVTGQSTRCDTAVTAYSTCLETATIVDTQDDDGACALCESTHDEQFSGITSTSSCDEVLQANCNAFQECISICAPTCSEQFIEYNFCLLTESFAEEGCTYQCGGSSSSTPSDSTEGTPSSTNPPNGDLGTASGETSQTVSPTSIDGDDSIPCFNEVEALQECDTSLLSSSQACLDCSSSQGDKASGVTAQSPCPEKIEAAKLVLQACVGVCASAQCATAYQNHFLCFLDLVDVCDYQGGTGGSIEADGSSARSNTWEPDALFLSVVALIVLVGLN